MATVIDTPEANPRMDTAAAAEYLGLQPETLDTWRCRGGGPAFFKAGRLVRYLRSDLDEWLLSRRVNCTAELDG